MGLELGDPASPLQARATICAPRNGFVNNKTTTSCVGSLGQAQYLLYVSQLTDRNSQIYLRIDDLRIWRTGRGGRESLFSDPPGCTGRLLLQISPTTFAAGRGNCRSATYRAGGMPASSLGQAPPKIAIFAMFCAFKLVRHLTDG